MYKVSIDGRKKFRFANIELNFWGKQITLLFFPTSSPGRFSFQMWEGKALRTRLLFFPHPSHSFHRTISLSQLFYCFQKYLQLLYFVRLQNFYPSKITRNFCSVNSVRLFFSEGICVNCRKILSVYKEKVPETGHMTAEVAKIADGLSELNLVSMYPSMKCKNKK